MNNQMFEYAQYLGKNVAFFFKPSLPDFLDNDYWVRVTGEVEFIFLSKDNVEFAVNNQIYNFEEVIFI